MHELPRGKAEHPVQLHEEESLTTAAFKSKAGQVQGSKGKVAPASRHLGAVTVADNPAAATHVGHLVAIPPVKAAVHEAKCGIHAPGSHTQGQPVKVIVRVTRTEIDSLLNPKNYVGEYGTFPAAQAALKRLQDGAGNSPPLVGGVRPQIDGRKDHLGARAGMHAVKIVDKRLHGLEYLPLARLIPQNIANHLAHTAVEVREALPPKHVILIALQDNRRQGRRRRNPLRRPDVAVAGVEAFLEQAGQVDLETVQGLAVIVKIVNVDAPIRMRRGKLLRHQVAQVILLARRHANLQHLGRRRIANVGILATGLHKDLLYHVHKLRLGLAHARTPGAIQNIRLGRAGMTVLNEHLLNYVLNFFYRRDVIFIIAGNLLQLAKNLVSQVLRDIPVAAPHSQGRLEYGIGNFNRVK